MANKRGAAPTGGTRMTIEKGLPAAAATEEERDNVERRESKLADLISRMGGKGRAKVYRIIDGAADPQYSCTWPVDDDLADNLEERLAELGGGKYAVKLYWGAKCEGSLTFTVDALSHPVKKTEAEQRREGGIMPQTPAELGAFISQALSTALQPVLLTLQQPRDNSSSELVKLMLLTSQQQAAEARALTERLLEGVIANRAPAANPANAGLRELADTVQLVDAIRGDGGGRDPRDEKRSLGARLIEGPMEKAAVRMADRIVDKFTAPEEPAPKRRPTPAPPPVSAAPVAASPPVPPVAAAPARPSQLPPATPTTPVVMPRGVKPLAMGELARIHQKPAPTPAPRAAEAVPAAVVTKG